MSFKREVKSLLKNRILESVGQLKEDFSPLGFASDNGISMQSVHRYLIELEESGQLNVCRHGRKNIYLLPDSSVSTCANTCEPSNSKHYPLSDIHGHRERTVINVGSSQIGDGNFTVIAGPCSIESEKQIVETAIAVQKAGATILRGGAYKPRTSPYSFQGLGKEGLKLLSIAKQATGMPTISEILNIALLDEYEDVDIIQVGARNMQNFELLKELGHINKPIFLKRGFSNTIDELLLSAEYIMSSGNENVILCERGIRTFETATRNTLDLSVIPLLKSKTHLPVFADPSHGTGVSDLVKPMSIATAAIGADGIMVEVHSHPEKALSDGAQAITPNTLEDICYSIKPILKYGVKY